MDTTRFIRGLKRIDSKLVVNKLPGRVWGVALKMPRHPDANEHGFVPVCSMTSPVWYGSTHMPDNTLVNQDGQIQARSWRTILKLLTNSQHIDRSKVNAVFGTRWAQP